MMARQTPTMPFRFNNFKITVIIKVAAITLLRNLTSNSYLITLLAQIVTIKANIKYDIMLAIAAPRIPILGMKSKLMPILTPEANRIIMGNHFVCFTRYIT